MRHACGDKVPMLAGTRGSKCYACADLSAGIVMTNAMLARPASVCRLRERNPCPIFCGLHEGFMPRFLSGRVFIFLRAKRQKNGLCGPHTAHRSRPGISARHRLILAVILQTRSYFSPPFLSDRHGIQQGSAPVNMCRWLDFDEFAPASLS